MKSSLQNCYNIIIISGLKWIRLYTHIIRLLMKQNLMFASDVYMSVKLNLYCNKIFVPNFDKLDAMTCANIRSRSSVVSVH